MGEPPVTNYPSQDSFYSWQTPSAPPPSEESVGHHPRPGLHPASSSSQSATGSSVDQRYFQPSLVPGTAYPQYIYRPVQAAPIPVEGGYRYSPAQAMLPIQDRYSPAQGMMPVEGGYQYSPAQGMMPVEGGYQYSPAQGMLPVQGTATCQTSRPLVSDGSLLLLLLLLVLVLHSVSNSMSNHRWDSTDLWSSSMSTTIWVLNTIASATSYHNTGPKTTAKQKRNTIICLQLILFTLCIDCPV